MTDRRLYNPSGETYGLAARKLKQGDIVSFPTETVYGLGADATNSKAVAKIYAAKRKSAHISFTTDFQAIVTGAIEEAANRPNRTTT